MNDRELVKVLYLFISARCVAWQFRNQNIGLRCILYCRTPYPSTRIMRPRSYILQRHYLSGRTLANICYLSCYVFLVGKKSRAEGCSARKGFSDASYKNSGHVLFNFLFFFLSVANTKWLRLDLLWCHLYIHSHEIKSFSCEMFCIMYALGLKKRQTATQKCKLSLHMIQVAHQAGAYPVSVARSD